MPELEIVKSDNAVRMTGMVTKNFYDNSYIGQWIFEVIGREYDEISDFTTNLKNEIFPQTCTFTIEIWEKIYGFEPDNSLSLDFRRQRVLAKIIGTKPINPEVIRRGVKAFTSAIDVEIVAGSSPFCFDITVFESNYYFDYRKLIRYIKEIKPSHIFFTLYLEKTETFYENIYSAGVISEFFSEDLTGEIIFYPIEGGIYFTGGVSECVSEELFGEISSIPIETAVYFTGGVSESVRDELFGEISSIPIETAVYFTGEVSESVRDELFGELGGFIFSGNIYSVGEVSESIIEELQ